ncbi:cytochrome P450 [Streptomyces canus]|uniref:cytochrome P450 n=1 Tax=Streptomyces canus TaxID=58343 RepID=UPI002253B82D|nr:cytochrome P450 [Streptomyces canus]MCX4856242.1 cytochrome P450 [Streptomyces canus]WSW38289.1 cytochrome P450 [Streptomyces canus]
MALTEPTCTQAPAPPAGQGHPLCPATTPGAITAHGAGEPGPLYAHLRTVHPVYHDPALNVWIVSRHQDIDTVLRDATGTFSTALGYLPLHPIDPQAQTVLEESAAVPVLSSLDPPHHARFRRQMTATFPATDRRMTAHQDLLREETTAAATALAARPSRTADLVSDYTRPLATAVLGRLLGIPHRDQPAIADQAAALSGLVWGHLDAPRQLAAAHALNNLWAYCHTLVQQRTHAPSNDLITAWLTHQDTDGTRFTPREVASTLMEVLITNAEITPRLIANTLYRLLTTGTLRALHCAGRLSDAINETLRTDPPLIGWLRSTTRNTHLASTPIPAGSRLLLLLASAPRDEHHGLAGPDTFTPDRPTQPPNLAFGTGIHYCPGAPYTRHLTLHAVSALADALPNLTLATPETSAPENWPLNAALRSPHTLTAAW